MYDGGGFRSEFDTSCLISLISRACEQKAVNIIDHQDQDDDLCVSVPGVVVVDLHHPAGGHAL